MMPGIRRVGALRFRQTTVLPLFIWDRDGHSALWAAPPLPLGLCLDWAEALEAEGYCLATYESPEGRN